jgi:hypothetical protein
MKDFTEPTRKLELSCEKLDEGEALRVVLEDFISKNGSISEDAGIQVHEWSDAPKRIRQIPNMSDYEKYTRKVIRITAQIPECSKHGMLFIAAKMYKEKALFKLDNLGMHFAAEAKLESENIHCEPVIGLLTYAVPWQGWRMEIPGSNSGRLLELCVTAMVPDDTDIEFEGYLIPDDRKNTIY